MGFFEVSLNWALKSSIHCCGSTKYNYLLFQYSQWTDLVSLDQNPVTGHLPLTPMF